MQTMISAWLGLSIPWIFACLVTFYLGTAALIVWLSFGSPLERTHPELQGRRRALLRLDGHHLRFADRVPVERHLGPQQAGGAHRPHRKRHAPRPPQLSAPRAERTTRPCVPRFAPMRRPSSTTNGPSWHWNSDRRRRTRRSMRCCVKLRCRERRKDVGIQRTMLDMVLRIRAAHEDRLVLSADRTVPTKWAAGSDPRIDHPGRDRHRAPRTSHDRKRPRCSSSRWPRCRCSDCWPYTNRRSSLRCSCRPGRSSTCCGRVPK